MTSKFKVFIVIAAFMLCYCGTKVYAGQKPLIGVAMSEYNDKWLSYLRNAMEDTAKTYTDFDFQFADANNDINIQLGQIETYIAMGAKAIVVVPVNVDATPKMQEKCREAGIPIIAVNRAFKVGKEPDCYVGSDSIIAGRLQMEFIGEQIGGEGNIAIIQGDPGNEAAVMRTAGVKEIIESKYKGKIKVVAEQAGYWQRDKGMAIAENWITAGIEIKAICSNNDEMAIGAIKALEKAGMLGEVIVAGVDATPDALKEMKAGKLNATVFQNPYGQGKGGIDMAVKIVRGEKVDKIFWIPYELVTPDKADDYMPKGEK